jgi:hypothetical protein
MFRSWLGGAAVALGLVLARPVAGAEGGLKDILKDLHAQGAEHWIYNNFEAAVAEAKRSGRPIFVTFRCVPCKACAGFDAEVAQGSDVIARLAADKFVALRQVEMKGVDLSQFQFDHDLNWAAMFINADGTVYGRYGTQSAEGPDAYNSVASLEKAMQRVLALHELYPNNKADLEAKKGAPKPYRTALEMPAMENKQKLAGPTARNNCVHCHNIHDAEQEQWRKEGTLTLDKLYRYPLPENMGLKIDRNDGVKVEKVIEGSAAARAGLKAGDSITHLNGQAIISIADMQWVLHGLANKDVKVTVRAERAGAPVSAEVLLTAGWKKTDFLWRGSRWSLKPRPGFWAPELKGRELEALKLGEGAKAYRIQWINADQSEGRKAKEAGLREGDLVVEVADKPISWTPEQFQMHVRMNYKVGDELPLTVVRGGKRVRVLLPLVD